MTTKTVYELTRCSPETIGRLCEKQPRSVDKSTSGTPADDIVESVAILDEYYEDLWLGGKASYRLGNVIEPGGEMIIYAPRLRCISETHGEAIEKFGGYAPLENVKELVAASGELQANLCVAAHLAHVSYAGDGETGWDIRSAIPNYSCLTGRSRNMPPRKSRLSRSPNFSPGRLHRRSRYPHRRKGRPRSIPDRAFQRLEKPFRYIGICAVHASFRVVSCISWLGFLKQTAKQRSNL